MGYANSGRRRQPTRMRVLRGNPGRRRLPVNEPTPPPAPASFDAVPPELVGCDDAVAEWRRIVPLLRTIGVITSAERAVLIALCQQWATYLGATRRCAEQGTCVVRKDDAAPVVNPYFRIARASLDACARLWGELGLTPTSRAKLTALQPVDAPVASKWAGDL